MYKHTTTPGPCMATSLNLKKFSFLKQSEHLEIIIDYNNTVKVSFLDKGNFMGLGQLHQDDTITPSIPNQSL